VLIRTFRVVHSCGGLGRCRQRILSKACVPGRVPCVVVFATRRGSRGEHRSLENRRAGQDANTRKLQRVTIAIVLVGIVLLLIGVAWVWVAPQVYALLLFLGAYISFVVAGIIGERIEEACRKEGKKEQGPTKPP
jgi:hypothetical protein